MKLIPQIFLLAVAVFAAASIKGAQLSTDHTPRDHDRLHPGLTASTSLILSVNDSARTVLIDPQTVSFDDSYDASPYIDGDTVSYVQFATKHRFLLCGDTLSYIGYENRASDFRLDLPTVAAVFPLTDGKSGSDGWSGHMLHHGSMVLRHVRGVSASSIDGGWTLTDGTDTIRNATRLTWTLDMTYADPDSVSSAMPDSVASERISEMQVNVKAMLSERLLTERTMWFSGDARYPVLTDSRVSRVILADGGEPADTVPLTMLAMYYPASFQYYDTGEDFMVRKPQQGFLGDLCGEYGHKDNDNGTSLTVGEPEASDGTVILTLSSPSGTRTATVTLFSDSGMRLTEPMEVTRGTSANSGGTVEYAYNLHGQTTRINGPGFSQNIYYADWRGTKLYNGSVSAMTWAMWSISVRRGYKYSYNGYGWLTSAEYGESEALTANKDRYTEKSTAFTRNGSVTRLQRNGLRADGTYGKVDDLTLAYDGNRVTGVSDAAPAVTQNGSMDYPSGFSSKVLRYNSFGALVSDGGRGITSISYDDLGNPVNVQYEGNRSTSNVYSATGENLKTVHTFSIAIQAGMSLLADVGDISLLADDMNIVGAKNKSTVEYHGNVIYRDGKVDMVLFPGGYAAVSGASVTFHYYTQDYLGNNRAVINGSTGAIEQTVAYYPYGGIIPDISTNPTTGQPYKFGGKELITANGLNEYDFGARQYYSAVPCFTKPDPMCEKYYWLSPYLYCGNNPVNLVDPSGMIWNDPDEAERLLNNVQDRIQTLQNQVSLLETSLDNTDMTDKERSLTIFMIKENSEKITLLKNSMTTIGIMGADQEHTYAFESTDANQPHMVRQGENGTVYVQASSDSMALHEITHVGQSLEHGGLVFVGDELRNASTELGKAAKNETVAYRTQYAMDPFNMPLPTISIKWINNKYIQHITNPLTGKPLYPYL